MSDCQMAPFNGMQPAVSALLVQTIRDMELIE